MGSKSVGVEWGLLALVVAGCGASKPPLPAAPAPASLVAQESFPSTISGPADLPGLEVREVRADNGAVGVEVRQSGARTVAVCVRVEVSSDDREQLATRLSALYLVRRLRDELPSRTATWSVTDEQGTAIMTEAHPDELKRTLKELKAALEDWTDGKKLAAVRQRFIDQETDRFYSHTNLGGLTIRRARYGADHPYGRDVSGVVDELRKLDAKPLGKLAKRALVASAVRVAVVGPPESFEGIDLADTLAPLRSGARTAGQPSQLPAPRQDEGFHFHMYGTGDEEQSTVVFMHVGPPRDSPEFSAFDKLCRGLAGITSEAARIFRHERGSSYGVNAYVETMPGVSECYVVGTLGPYDARDLFGQQQKLIQRIQAGDASEVAQAEDLRMRRLAAERRERPTRLAAHVAKHGAGVDLNEAATDDVTEDQLIEVARKYLRPKHLDIAVFTGDLSLYLYMDRKGELTNYRIDKRDG
jgi:predicted Zn-dependent peptidase